MSATPCWEYHVEGHLDLLNVGTRACSGVLRINELAEDGWEPHLLLENGAMGYKTRLLFRRKIECEEDSGV